MRQSAGNPAFPGTLVPSPANPVGQKRVHTPRHDSRQWSVSSASKSRETSLVAALVPSTLPITSTPKQKTSVENQTNELRSPLVHGSQGNAIAEGAASEHEPSAEMLRSKRDLKAPLRENQVPKPSRTAHRQGSERAQLGRGSAAPKSRSEKRKEAATPRTDKTRGRELAASVMLKRKDHAQRTNVAEAMVADYAPGPDFMYLSSGSSDQANEAIDSKPAEVDAEMEDKTPDPHGKELDYERVQQRHGKLNEVLNALDRHDRRTSESLCVSSTPQATTGVHRSRSLCLPLEASTAEERPAWMNVGHFRNVSWPVERLRQAERVAVPERRRNLSESPNRRIRNLSEQAERETVRAVRLASGASTMSNGRDRAVDAVSRRSLDVERGTGLFPHTPIRAPLPARVEEKGCHTEQDDMEAEQQTLDADERIPANRPKQSRFVEHLRENEEVLKRLGVEFEAKQRASSGSWWKSLKMRHL